MIFWRGWGILAFLAIGVSVGLTALLAMLTGTDMNGVTWQGLPAFLIGGTGVYFLGRHLNITGPTKKLANLIAQHNAQAQAQGYPMPASSMDPEQLEFGPEEQALLKQVRNQHTLFFIPMQWWGFVLPMIGIAMTITNMNGSN